MAEDNYIPGPGRAVDGISNLPGRAIVPYINWEELHREFLLNPEHVRARTWLSRVKMWPTKKILSGHTTKMTAGWSDEKALLEQRKTEQAIQAMLDEQRKRIPDLIKAKLNLVVRIIADVGRWDRLQPAEKKLCFEILKTELGEPTSIKTVGLVTPKDPVEALLEEYGMMAEGRIIIDAEQAESPGAGEAAPALDSGPPAEVPSDAPL